MIVSTARYCPVCAGTGTLLREESISETYGTYRCRAVIEHLREPVHVLRKISFFCSSDTLVFLCTRSGSSEFVELYMRKLLRDQSFTLGEPVLDFSKPGMQLYLEKQGFEVVRSAGAACSRRPS